MLLAKWLKEKAVPRKDFAARIGVSPSYITALCNRTVWPGKEVAAEIARQTQGQVTATDFLADAGEEGEQAVKEDAETHRPRPAGGVAA